MTVRKSTFVAKIYVKLTAQPAIYLNSKLSKNNFFSCRFRNFQNNRLISLYQLADIFYIVHMTRASIIVALTDKHWKHSHTHTQRQILNVKVTHPKSRLTAMYWLILFHSFHFTSVQLSNCSVSACFVYSSESI